jgi:hypothetical protein
MGILTTTADRSDKSKARQEQHKHTKSGEAYSTDQGVSASALEEERLPLLGPVRLDLEPGYRIENRDPDRCKWRNELGHAVIRVADVGGFSTCCKVPGCMVGGSKVPRDGMCGRPNCPVVPFRKGCTRTNDAKCIVCRKALDTRQKRSRQKSKGGSGECATCNHNNIVG